MIDEMLKKVRSPFTDELIQDLIKKYISYGCDDKLLYRQINNVEMNDNSIINESLKKQIISKIKDFLDKKQIHYEEGGNADVTTD